MHSLQTRNLPIDRVDGAGNTALHLAAQHGHVAVVAWLLQRGARVDAAQGGANPLHRAAFSGAVGTMTLLLQATEENDHVLLAGDTSFGDQATILHKACAGGRFLVVQLILDELATRCVLQKGLSLRDSNGQTPLEVAKQKHRNREKESDSVVRWNQVAGGKPDWGICKALIEKYSFLRESSSLAPCTLAKIEMPSHLNVKKRLDNSGCFDDACSDGNCLTSSWEASFRQYLGGKIGYIVIRGSTMRGGTSQREEVKCGKCTTDYVEKAIASPTCSPASPAGRPCEKCGSPSISLYRRGTLTVCRVCSIAP